MYSLAGLGSLWVCLGLIVAAAEGLATPPAPAPRRKLDYSAAPERRDVAERVRQCANTYYPLVCALLADGDTRLPRQFDVCLKRDLPALWSEFRRTAAPTPTGSHSTESVQEPSSLV